jgi:hypothetical protein
LKHDAFVFKLREKVGRRHLKEAAQVEERFARRILNQVGPNAVKMHSRILMASS